MEIGWGSGDELGDYITKQTQLGRRSTRQPIALKGGSLSSLLMCSSWGSTILVAKMGDPIHAAEPLGTSVERATTCQTRPPCHRLQEVG